MLEQSIAKAPPSPRENKTPDRTVRRAFISAKPHTPGRSPVGNISWAASAVTKKMRLRPEAGNHRGSRTEKIAGIDSRNWCQRGMRYFPRIDASAGQGR